MSHPQVFGDFRCVHCNNLVSSAHWISGVKNRNHCPLCLWSRHMDLYSAGDRLSACKAPMQPVALTAKRSRNKYGHKPGELMLVHLCTDCGDTSINRVATDDDAQTLLDVFSTSFTLSAQTRDLLLKDEINILSPDSLPVLQLQLFGGSVNIQVTEIV